MQRLIGLVVMAVVALPFVSARAVFVGGSPFYEFEVIAQVGDSVFGATDGPLYISDQGIHPFVSVNDRGQVALIPHMYQVVTRTVLDQTVVVTNSVAPVVTQQPGTTQLRWLGAYAALTYAIESFGTPRTKSTNALYRGRVSQSAVTRMTNDTERLHLLDTFHSEAFFPLGTSVFFRASHTNGSELWVSDGTEPGSRMVRNIQAGTGSSAPMDFAALDGILYFSAIQDGSGRELWETDGTTEGTRMVEDLIPGPTSSDPQSLTVRDGALYYFARDGGDDLSLRRYVPEGPTAFEVWMDTVAPQLTGDERLPLADPYGAGFSNILLHDLDSPPGQSLGAGVFTGRAGIIGPGTLWNTDRMELRYLRRSNFWTRGLRFYVEASSNVTVPNWSQWSINPTQTVVDLGNGYEEVIIQFDADRSRLREFYRLVLEPHIQIPATTPGYHQ